MSDVEQGCAGAGARSVSDGVGAAGSHDHASLYGEEKGNYEKEDGVQPETHQPGDQETLRQAGGLPFCLAFSSVKTRGLTI